MLTEISGKAPIGRKLIWYNDNGKRRTFTGKNNLYYGYNAVRTVATLKINLTETPRHFIHEKQIRAHVMTWCMHKLSS